jgi:uncharacterized protein YjeT (DUF2065 family)
MEIVKIGFFTVDFFNGIIYLIGAILFSLFPETIKNKINKMRNFELRVYGIFIEVTGIILCGTVIFHLIVYFLIFFSLFEQPLTFFPLRTWIILVITGTTGIILLIEGMFLILVPLKIKERINKLSSFSLRLYGGSISFVISALFLLVFKHSVLQTLIKFLK